MQATIGPGLFLDQFESIGRSTGRPISWTALLAGAMGPDGHRGVLERSQKLQQEGVEVVPQVACRPIMFEYQLKAPFPFESSSLFKPVSAADLEGKKRIYADPEFRKAFAERTSRGGAFPERAARKGIWERTDFSSVPTEPALEGRNVAEVAAERGVDPSDLVLDLSLASNLEARFRLAALNTEEDIIAELLQHPAAVLGLSDAGAHASQLCDACYSTHLLSHWVRDEGVLSLEEGVRQLTSRPAEVFGIEGRGRLAPGFAADLVSFDPDAIGCSPLRRVHDLPGGADPGGRAEGRLPGHYSLALRHPRGSGPRLRVAGTGLRGARLADGHAPR